MLKKFGKKITKKGLLIAGGIAIALVAVIIAIAIVSSKGEGTKKKNFTPDSELARAMTYDQFTDADSSVDGTDYVKFGAFFLRDINNDGYAEKIKGTCKQVGKEDTLYMELNVLTNGYLENGVITINSDNFYLQTAIPKDSEVKDNVISNNTKQISLNQINNGTQKLLTGIVRSGNYSYDSQKFAAIGNDTTKMSKVNSVTLTGTHVAADGTRTQISKTVELNMDWYGTTKAEFPYKVYGTYNLSQTKDNTNIIDDENKLVNLEFNVGIQEVNHELVLKGVHVEGVIPQLNGYDPANVELVDSDAEFNYDTETRTFTINKEAVLNEDGTIKKQCYDSTIGNKSYNIFKLKVTYTLEAYQSVGADTVELKIPVKGYYEGFNNSNSEFSNPYKSNVAENTIVVTFSKPTGNVAIFDIAIGDYRYGSRDSYFVSKKKPLQVYNEISDVEDDDEYIVTWYGSTGGDGETSGMVMKETADNVEQVSDQFIKADSTVESMEDLTTNVGIRFACAELLLGEDGWIKVYDDETNELIHEFTKSDWNEKYVYDRPIKHIRVETSKTYSGYYFMVYNTKKLDDEYIVSHYTREQFDNLKYIKSTLTGYVDENYVNTSTKSANYEVPYSIARIYLNRSAITTQETEKDVDINVVTSSYKENNEQGWKNGIYLVKLPKDIIDIKINQVKSSNSNIKIDNYERIEKDGEVFVKIMTANEEIADATITINCDLTADSRIPTTTEYFELYAYNEEATDYAYPTNDIYDINGNGNVSEKINKYTTSITLNSPSSLLTNETLTNYDADGNVTVAPKTATVEKNQRAVTVNVEVNNNYSNTISEVKILGRLPFEGNKYAINGHEIGSEFTATMSKEGIIVPDALKNVATIYYSENGEATNDLENTENGWISTPSDFSKIKSYLVDLGNYTLAKGEKHTITYNLDIPEGVAYNKVSYSHHAVYFSLDTAEGKYRTQTEPNKVGIMIAKKYDLELTKYQAGKDILVDGATYTVCEEGAEEASTITTENGKALLKGLYIDKTYTIKEIKSPNDYELNTDVIKFSTSEENSKLVVNKIEGSPKNITSVQVTDGTNYKVQVEVEDEIKGKLKISKVEKGTSTGIENVKYKLTGEGISKIITTDQNGETNYISGIKIGKEYTLKETKADGYYLADEIKFTITNTNGTYAVNFLNGTVKNYSLTEEDGAEILNLEIENEKKPVYNLEISKIQRVTSANLSADELKLKAEKVLSNTDTVYLANAKFKLYKGNKEIGEYITDSSGKISITGLYQYVDGKDEDAIYKLTEVASPDGYSKAKDITFKVDGTSGDLKFINTDGTNEAYTTDGNNVKLVIEDSPSFRLVKKDAETQQVLANVKFAIYNIDNEEAVPAQNSKGEIIGTKEKINNQEYYVVTTDEKGEITADLQAGLYKAIEIQADEKYDLSDAVYYFGIGTSKEGKKETVVQKGVAIGGNNRDEIKAITNTSDGGYITGCNYYSDSITLANGDVVRNTSINSSSTQMSNILLIKYSKDDEIEWYKNIGGSNGSEMINTIMETNDEGYVIGGCSVSSNLELENGINLSHTNNGYGLLIKYDKNGECQWAKVMGNDAGDTEVTAVCEKGNGNIMAVGTEGAWSIDFGNNISCDTNGGFDGFIAEYTDSGEIQSAKFIGGNDRDEIYTAVIDDDDNLIIGGYFESDTVELSNEISIKNNATSTAMLIKYNSAGELQWAKTVEGNNDSYSCINAIDITSFGEIVVAGGYNSTKEIDLGNSIILNATSALDGMIIKYSQSGDIKYAKSITGNYADKILSINMTSDNGYIIGGYFESDELDAGNNIKLNNSSDIYYNSKKYYDGMIVKYDSTGEAQWGKCIAGNKEDEIYSAIECNDGTIMAVGYYESNSVSLENGAVLENKGKRNGVLVKITEVELADPVVVSVKNASRPEILAQTVDGGYIVKDGNAYKKYNKSDETEWIKKEISNFGLLSSSATADNGIILSGYFNRSVNVDGYTATCSKTSGLVVKLDENGKTEWIKTIIGNNDIFIRAISTTKDNGYVMAVDVYGKNSVFSYDDVKINFTLKNNYVIAKIDEKGSLIWTKAIQSADDLYLKCINENIDRGIYIAGYCKGDVYDMDNNIIFKGASDDAFWIGGTIIKMDSDGKIEYTKLLGKTFYNAITCENGDYIVSCNFEGKYEEKDGEIIIDDRYSYLHCMLISYSLDGKINWYKDIELKDTMNSGINVKPYETSDGGLALCITSTCGSLNVDDDFRFGKTDQWDDITLVKYDKNNNFEWGKRLDESREADDRGFSGVEASNIIQLQSGEFLLSGYGYAKKVDFGNGKIFEANSEQNGFLIKVINQVGVPEVQELDVENQRKQFKITTDIEEIDGIKGGSISGEDLASYEKVKYGDASSKEITMVPDENYEIIGITVNGKEYTYTKAADGSYTMPQFTNMTEDKHVVVKYALKDNKITINKIDKDTGEKLSGAKFKLDQMDERPVPTKILGDWKNNGQEYNEVDIGNEVAGKLGKLINNGTYYFIQNADGTYTPTNSKTYQTANGGSAGIQSSTANSYIPIDLTGLTGQYAIVVNASCSSESADKGYVAITENTTTVSTSQTGKMVYIYGTQSAKDYTSAILEGGKTYYLHMGYYKDSSVDTGEDQIIINSIKLYNATNETNVYNFKNNNGKYESTNAGKDSTVANSYIPIDLTNYTGKYNLTVNAEVSSQSSDYGYATVTENTTRPSYSNSAGRFIYISGTQSAKDYTTVLQGGKMYYLHLGYYKNASISSGSDKFTVNSVNITLNDSELYHTTVETNSDGQAITQLPFGKYSITETEAPEGYILNSSPTVVEFRSTDGAVHEFTIENEEKAKLVVHHFIKGTTTKVAEDENLEGTAGEKYTTNAKLDLSKYELEKDSNGAYVLPANATGTYKTGTTEVTYYYVEKQIPLTVHHYIEGTTDKVPLKAGGTASDVTGSGKEGESYITSAIADDKLSDEYELVEIPSNANGTYNGNEVVVTYYYKKVARDVNLIKYKEDGKTPLAGARFTIDGQEYITDSNGKITTNLEFGTYDVTETEAPDGYKLPSNPTTKVTVTKATLETINITNEKKTGTVTVHHYIEGTTDKVPLADGGTADDEVKTGNIGDIYATKIVDNLSEGYELSLEPSNGSGTYIDGNIEVIYYYKTIPTSVLVHHYLEGTTTKLADDVTFDGIVGDNYTTGVATVDSKYEVVAIPANANGKMTREQIVVIYYYRVKDTSVLVHHYKEGTSESLSKDVTINGKVDDAYTTNVATDIPSKYELVATPTNASGKMTVAQTVVTYYYRLKSTGVDVHYYKEGTTEKVSEDVAIEGKVDQAYTTTPATDVESKYELVGTPTNATGTMTESRITVIYYYRLKDTSVLVHHYLENTTTKIADDVTINGKVDSSYKTVANTDLLAGKYELVAEPTNKSGTMTEAQIVVIYYYRVKDTSVLVHHYIKGTTTSLSDDVTIKGKIDDKYTTTVAKDIPEQYELVAEPTNKSGTMTEEQIVVTYYYQLKNYPYTVNYLEKGTNKVLHDAKQGGELVYGSTVNSSDEKKTIDGYNYDSVDKDTLTIGTTNNVINIYYTKRTDLSYKVNYLEKGTNKVLHDQKVQDGMTFDSEVISRDEVIDIDGYNFDSADKASIKITTGENVINIYYTKRTDLSYKVNYLEKGTNKVLQDQKTQDGMTFWTIINASDEIIDIEGYNYDSVDKDSIIIGISNNVINIYYTKRNDLSYKVNYLEKDTNKVLHNQKVQDGMTFESTVNSADEVIDIYGYKYDSVDKDTLTITTGENVINIYYTKKDTKVTVHYYEEGTTNKVSENVEIPGKVFDDYTTESASDIPSKYELVAEPENKNGIMTEDEITVIYYYRKKATQVIVHYYEENTTKKLSEDVTIDGRVDDKYTTISATDIPIKYELVSTPSNANGLMTETTIEVIYYYRVKDAVVHVRYLEKGTNKVLADPDRLDGKVDEDYQTMPKEIDGYQLVEHTGNEKGKFEVEPLTITYYYLYKTKATVQYIDKITGEILEQSTTEGLEGDNFVTESKDFENYVLVEEPPEKTVKMTKEEQVLKYYYIHISGGVIEKHIDIISNEILANVAYEGNEGDEYDIPSRTFDGYDLVEDKLPENAKGTMKVEPVEVIYYYIYRSKVTSEYIDKNTGEKLTEDVTQNGHEGDDYTTDRKTFDDYKLVEVPSNADGSMTKDDITVTYYYVHTSGGVIVNHIDIKTGKQLLDETKEEGYEGDPYETHEENIPEYDLVKEKYPENATGKMTIEPTRVTYYYIKKTEVNVKYVDKETGEEIDEPTNIPGHEGDDYNTEPKDVPGYDLIEEPENKDGTMTADPIDVIYYYKRPAKVIVNYYDIDTKEKLADEIEITGHQNDEYTTEQKDIKYYEIAKVPENKEGKMVVTVTKDENGKEIVDDTTYVNYYYRKLIFNLRVDKTIVSVIVNGQETGINGTLGKVEVHRKNISTANVKVVYKIKVTNDSELTGKANVVENIPSGMTMLSENNPDWTIKETTASLETDEIKPGESREYQVVLGWQNGDNNVGTKTNMVSITTENEADFDEQFETDNVSKADLIVAVGTGEVPYAKIAGGILLIMISITAGVYVISKKRQ